MKTEKFNFKTAGVEKIPAWAATMTATVELVTTEPKPKKKPKTELVVDPTNPIPADIHNPVGPIPTNMDEENEMDEDEEEMDQPINVLARSKEPIDHPYWGRVVHDMDGMKLSGDRIPLDYAHMADENHENLIGYCQMSEADKSDGLKIPAVMTPHSDNVAGGIIKNMKRGIPYQASINFGGDGIKVQHVDSGETTPVNGYSFDGPGIVIRQWPMRGCALCAYGADSHTSANFSKSNPEDVTVTVFSGTSPVPTQESSQMTTQTTTPTAGAPVEFTKDDYVKAFGKERAALYLFDGTGFTDAMADFSKFKEEKHQAELKAQADELADLKTKLANMPRGNDAASFSVDGKVQQENAGRKSTALSDPNRMKHKNGAEFGSGAGREIARAALETRLSQLNGQQPVAAN
jgi:hypothetical protein